MISVLIQSVIYQLVFLLIYDLFLKKETFFNYNRLYLLVSPLISLLIPFIVLPGFQQIIPLDLIDKLPAINLSAAEMTQQSEVSSGFTSIQIMMSIWLLGVVLGIGLFTKKYIQILALKREGIPSTVNGIPVLILKNTTTAFSFINTIYLGDQLSKKQQDTILLHEKTHIDQRHSIDLIVFEILKIIFWFNPLIYLFQNRMEILQEFIADASISKQQDKKEYYQSLLSQVFETQSVSFINTFFNQSLIKKRIIMLQKSKSKKIALSKYLLIIPIVFGMLVYSSCAQETEPELKQDEAKSKNKSQDKAKGDAVPFAKIDKVPTYPGCTGDNQALKDCMVKNIWTHVGQEFNTKVANSNKDINGKQRIMVNFKIDNTGKITNIRAKTPFESLEEEAIRVVSLLPNMEPGEQDGKQVAVLYSLPIIFELK